MTSTEQSLLGIGRLPPSFPYVSCVPCSPVFPVCLSAVCFLSLLRIPTKLPFKGQLIKWLDLSDLTWLLRKHGNWVSLPLALWLHTGSSSAHQESPAISLLNPSLYSQYSSNCQLCLVVTYQTSALYLTWILSSVSNFLPLLWKSLKTLWQTYRKESSG